MVPNGQIRVVTEAKAHFVESKREIRGSNGGTTELEELFETLQVSM